MQQAKAFANVKAIFPFYGLLRIRYTLGCLLMVLLLGAPEEAQAQGIERESLANEGSTSRGSDVNQPYNLQLGPVTLRTDASMTTSFNDNINVAKTGRLADIIIEPSLGIRAFWQATDLNALTFDVGIGYAWYTMHSENSSLIISPRSQAQFNIFVDDIKFNLHDYFSFQQDPIQVGQLSNVSQFPRFLNDAGIQADWDLGDIIISAGYDHTNLWVFKSAYQYLDYQSDTLSPRITFKVNKTIDAGISTSFSAMRYDQNIQNDNTTLSAGPFVTAQLSEYLSVNAQAGWYSSNYDRGGLNGDSQNINSYYANAGVNHRINNVLTEALTAGREFIPGITSNFTQRTYANYTPAWQATTNINLALNFWWENLIDSDATFHQTSNRYGTGLTLGYAITDHATVNLGYQYVLKIANPGSFGYDQNVATVGFRYQF